MMKMMSVLNGRVREQGRQLTVIADLLMQQGGSPNPTAAKKATLRSRLPCHSKHALRALDNDIGADKVLFLELVRTLLHTHWSFRVDRLALRVTFSLTGGIVGGHWSRCQLESECWNVCVASDRQTG